ncbi:MAG: hypothetical protein KKH44_07880 [Bacteroidetes bacterium]|nr:hypothetical protein [Bacteroidota bacterium]
MNLQKLTKLKTEYKSIAIKSILLFVILILLFLAEIFTFWGIYGEGATASRISEIWYVELILDNLPIVIIGGYLMFQIFKNYNEQKYIESKTNIITLFILIILFLMRNGIQQLIF